LKFNFYFLIISHLTTSTKVAQDITSKQNILLTFSNLITLERYKWHHDQNQICVKKTE